MSQNVWCAARWRFHRPLAFAGLALGLMSAWGCEAEKPAAATAKAGGSPEVYTTFYPTTYFTQRIAGDKVNVACPCPAGTDPAYWMPDEKTIQAYQQADLIIINGASFEKWPGKAMLPPTRVVDTAKPLADEFIVLKDAVKHTHGPAGSHTHEGVDGHTWLDPVNAKTQASEIKKALIERFPKHKDAFEKGYAALATDLDALDASLKALSAKLGDQVLLNSHPAYNYLARRYGWKVKYFHLDPTEMPSDATFAKVKASVEQTHAKIMLWESEPTEDIAARFAALGLKNVVFSPCEGLDAEELRSGKDFMSVMRDNISRLGKSL